MAEQIKLEYFYTNDQIPPGGAGYLKKAEYKYPTQSYTDV